jgi:hypothetical protein
MKTCSAASSTLTSTLDEPVQAQRSLDEVSDVSAITNGSFEDFAMDFDWDVLMGDEGM